MKNTHNCLQFLDQFWECFWSQKGGVLWDPFFEVFRVGSGWPILASSWYPLGLILTPSCPILAPSCPNVGPSCLHFSLSWPYLSPSWPHLGPWKPYLGPSRSIFGPSWLRHPASLEAWLEVSRMEQPKGMGGCRGDSLFSG